MHYFNNTKSHTEMCKSPVHDNGTQYRMSRVYRSFKVTFGSWAQACIAMEVYLWQWRIQRGRNRRAPPLKFDRLCFMFQFCIQNASE